MRWWWTTYLSTENTYNWRIIWIMTYWCLYTSQPVDKELVRTAPSVAHRFDHLDILRYLIHTTVHRMPLQFDHPLCTLTHGHKLLRYKDCRLLGIDKHNIILRSAHTHSSPLPLLSLFLSPSFPPFPLSLSLSIPPKDTNLPQAAIHSDLVSNRLLLPPQPP